MIRSRLIMLLHWLFSWVGGSLWVESTEEWPYGNYGYAMEGHLMVRKTGNCRKFPGGNWRQPTEQEEAKIERIRSRRTSREVAKNWPDTDPPTAI